MQLSLEMLGEPGLFFHENSRHCAENEMKPCLWTTLGARIHFSHCSPKASTMANVSSTSGTLANSPELQGLFRICVFT